MTKKELRGMIGDILLNNSEQVEFEDGVIEWRFDEGIIEQEVIPKLVNLLK